MAKAVPGQTYGKVAEQVAAQRAIPVAGSPQSPTPAPPATAGGAGGGLPPALAAMMGGGGAPVPMPGEVTRLDAPSERPGEPITAGVPVGDGPGIEALGPMGMAGSPDDAILALRAAYSAYPSEELRAILELVDLA